MYQTRQATGHCYSISQTPHSERIKKSFYYKSIGLWNSLPAEVRKIERFKEFKSKLKLWTQSNVPFWCNLFTNPSTVTKVYVLYVEVNKYNTINE